MTIKAEKMMNGEMNIEQMGMRKKKRRIGRDMLKGKIKEQKEKEDEGTAGRRRST